MSDEAQESLLDEPLQEIAEEAAAEKDANPKVIVMHRPGQAIP